MTELGLGVGIILDELVMPLTTDEKCGLVELRCCANTLPGKSNLAFIATSWSLFVVRSRTLLTSFSFSVLRVYRVPISDGISNC